MNNANSNHSGGVVAIEFSRPFNTEKLHDAARVETITANETERAALAKRLGLIALDKLVATITLERVPNDPRLIDLRGSLQASVVQPCVVTLEPVAENVQDAFDTVFAPEAYVAKWLAEHGEDDYDAPEPLEHHNHIDLGELTAQYLSLALNPYPRKADVALPPELTGEDKAVDNPFAILAKLKE